MVTKENEIDKYYQNPALNQSRLKLLLKGMEAFKNSSTDTELYYEEKESFLIGSAVDCKLTSNQEEFDSHYYVSQNEDKPSDSVMSIINMVFDKCPKGLRETLELNNLQDLILQAVVEHKYYSNLTDQVRINKILAFSKYFDDLKFSEGKQVLSKDQSDLVNKISESFKSSPVTSDYFKSSRTKKVFYQQPIYFVHKGVKCKALLDIFIMEIDSTGKCTSVEVIDIKTMSGSVGNFPSSFKKYRYDIQAAWYMLAVQNFIKKEYSFDIKIKPFKFLVESTTYTNGPVVFELTDKALNIGANGRKQLMANGILVKPEVLGYEQLIDDYIYYERQGWKQDRLLDVNNGVLKLGWDKIETEKV